MDSIIDNFHETFSRYVESPLFNSCLFQHFNLDSPERRWLEVDLLTDEEVIGRAASKADQEKWKADKTERESFVKALRTTLAPPYEIDQTRIAAIAAIVQEVQHFTAREKEDHRLRLAIDFPRFEIDDAIIGAVEQERPQRIMRAVARSLDAQAGDEGEAATDELFFQLAAPFYS